MLVRPRVFKVISIVLLLRYVIAQQQTYRSPEDFLKRACARANDQGDTAYCWLPSGQWRVQSATPPAMLTRPLTVMNDLQVESLDGVDVPALTLPEDATGPLFILAPNTTFSLNNLRLIGAQFSASPSPQISPSLLSLRAFSLSSGARVRLVNVSITTPDCRALFLRQGLACFLSPSPNFIVGSGFLTILSYNSNSAFASDSSSWEAVNVTLTCSGKDPRPSDLPPCLAEVVTTPRQLLTALTMDARSMSGNLSVYIARNMSLLGDTTGGYVSKSTATIIDGELGSKSSSSGDDNRPGSHSGSAAPAGASALPPAALTLQQLPLIQPLLILCGHPDGTTWLDLSGTTSLIAMHTGTRVLLQDLTLVGLPPGPSDEYPYGLLRAPVWTFILARRALGGLQKERLALLRVRLELSPIEVMMWAHDALAPAEPKPPPPPALAVPAAPLCAKSSGFFANGEGNASWVPVLVPAPGSTMAAEGQLLGLALLIRHVSTAGSQMSFTSVLFVPAVAEPPPTGGAADWRRHPLCQLLPDQPPDRPPLFSADLKNVMEVYMQIMPTDIMPEPGVNGPYIKVLGSDALLTTGSRHLGQPTFTEDQASIPSTFVLLGDPFRPRRLDLALQPAVINLHLPDAAMTLRSMVLVGLAPAGFHPRATAPPYAPGAAPSPPPSGAAGLPSTWAGLPKPHDKAPAGRDPTGGLPPGLTNFTSCLWALDFDRGAAWSTGGAEEYHEYGSAYGSPSINGRWLLPVVFLDSVVLVVPKAEAALLAWVWAMNGTSDLTDPWVAKYLSDKVRSSSLAGGEMARLRLISDVQVAAAAAATASVTAAGGYDFNGSLIFERLQWCGLIGRNVTITAVGSAAAGSGSTAGDGYRDAVIAAALTLPITYPWDRVATPLNENPMEGMHRPPSSALSKSESEGCCKGGTTGMVVPVVCGVVGGIVVILAAGAIFVLVSRRRQRRSGGGRGGRPAALAAAEALAVKSSLTGDDEAGSASGGSFQETSRRAQPPDEAPHLMVISGCEQLSPMAAATAAVEAPQAADRTTSNSSLHQLQQELLQQQVRQLVLALHVRLALLKDDLSSNTPGVSASAPGTTPLAFLDEPQAPHLTRRPCPVPSPARAAFTVALDFPTTTTSTTTTSAAAPSTALTVTPALTARDKSLNGLSHSSGAEGGMWAPPDSGVSAVPAAAAEAGGDSGCGIAGRGAMEALTVTGELGRGAQGVVYQGVWKGLPVAVKNMLLHRAPAASARGGRGGGGSTDGLSTFGTFSTTPATAAASIGAAAPWPPTPPQELAQQRALREAVISIRASQHPNVVATYQADAFSMHDGECWKITLIMQLCDGGSLRRALDSGLLAQTNGDSGTQPSPGMNPTTTTTAACPGDAYSGNSATTPQPPRPLQLCTLLLVARDVAAGLAQLHSTNIVHGDVSSANVLLVSAPSRFGSSSGSGTRTGVGNSVGTTITIRSSSGTTSMSVPFDKLHDEGGGYTWLSNESAAFAALLKTSDCSNEPFHPSWGDRGSARTSKSRVQLGSCAYVAKLGDFGLAEVLPAGSDHVRTQSRRSSAYTAPETALEGLVGPPADVYAWGVLCWELALGISLPRALASPVGAAVRTWLAAADTASRECAQLGALDARVGAASAAMGNAVKEKRKEEGKKEEGAVGDGGALLAGLLTWPPHVPAALVVLVGDCLAADPAARPSARSLVERLEHIIASL